MVAWARTSDWLGFSFIYAEIDSGEYKPYRRRFFLATADYKISFTF